MKITCLKSDLLYAVQTVQKAITNKTPLPILAGIYIVAKTAKVELQATDYEIGIKCSINANIDQPGEIVITGHLLQEIVRKLPEETVVIESNYEEKTIIIESGAANYNLLCLPPEEFPVIKPLESSNSFVIKDIILRELIKKTTFACANDEIRPIFTGALLEIENNIIKMIATNTHRLVLRQAEIDNNTNNNISIIIPSKLLNELAKLLNSDLPTDITIYWHNKQIAFSFENVYIISRLIEGKYPDYKRVIPNGFTTTIELEKNTFFNAVERISLLSKEGKYNIIKLNFNEKNLVLTSNNPDIGKAIETIPAIQNGNDLEVSFNSKYVSDILKNIDSDKILFLLNTSLSPACIKPSDDDNYTYIITPVRTTV